MGEIILLNDGLYKYELPSIPKERDILYHNLSKANQYWRSHADEKKQLDIRDVKKMPERDKIAYMDMWRNRWENGMWIMNNGEPTYLTGLHVEHLCFNTYNSQKLTYFDDERFIFYFLELSEKNKACTGRTWVKPRRAKMTTIMCSVAQRNLISDFSNFITIQSDTLDKAQKSYMNPIIDSYTRRPFWTREDYYAPNGKKPRKNLELRSNIVRSEDDELMGGTINIFPALAKATDGLEAVQTIQDEFSKVTESSPYETFEVNKKVTQNFRRQGMNDCLSSSGDSKDAAKATMEWHKLIANSNPEKIDQFGKTASGNWKYFISAIHSQYVPPEYTNKYGIVDKDLATQWVLNEHRKYPEGTKEKIYAMYKLPLKEEHALLSSSTQSLFSKARISARLTDLEGLTEEDKPYVRGRLDETSSGRIIFTPDPAGYWLFAVLPWVSELKGIDTSNRFRIIDGIFFPPVNPEGVIGFDPINLHKILVKSNHYSQAAGVAHKKFDYFGSGIEDEKVALLLFRPDDPHDANKEIIKFCKFTGYPCMHECSVTHVYEDFEKARMLPFLMKVDGYYGLKATPSNTNAGIAMLQARYRAPQTPEEKDQIAIHPFEDCLRSHDNFDPSNTTAFDPTMAEAVLEHGLKQLIFTNATANSQGDLLRRKQMIIPIRR